MANTGKRRRGAAAALAAAGFGLLAVAAYPGASLAQGKSGDKGSNMQSTKTPGQTCDQFKKDSDAYKSCVENAAKMYKKDGGHMGGNMGQGQGMQGQGMGQGMDHGKGMGQGQGMGSGDGMDHGKGMGKGKGHGY